VTDHQGDDDYSAFMSLFITREGSGGDNDKGDDQQEEDEDDDDNKDSGSSSEGDADGMHIVFHLPSNIGRVKAQLDASTTIKEAKSFLAGKKGIKSKDQRFRLSNDTEASDNNATLAFYNINDGDAVTVLIRGQGGGNTIKNDLTMNKAMLMSARSVKAATVDQRQ